jgi:hypothetical protein
MKRRVVIAVVGVFAVGCVAAYAVAVRPRLLVMRQIANHADCQGWDAWIKGFRQEHGSYPTELPSRAIDRWSHPLHYKRMADGYLLISFGRDGKPDGSDYLALRNLGDHPSGYRICGQYDADEVMSDRGWHRVCGK